MSSVEDLLALHGLSQYSKKLVENGYDDIRFIAEITDEELMEIGVLSPGERARVSHAFSIFQYHPTVSLFMQLLKIFSAYAS